MSKINSHNYEAFLLDYFDGNLSEELIAELKTFVLKNPQLEIDLDDTELPSFAKEGIEAGFKKDLKKTGTFLEDEELINYLENKLSGTDKKSFEQKLAADAGLNKELEAYKKTILLNEPALVYSGKGELVKTDDDLIVNNTALAYVEGQLEASEKLQFEAELKTNPALQTEVALFNKTKLEATTSIQFPDKGALKKETKVIALFSFRKLASMAAAILLLIGLVFVFNYYNSKPIISSQLANSISNNANKVIDTNDSLNLATTENKALIANNVTNTAEGKSPTKVNRKDLNIAKTNTVALNEKEVLPLSNKNIENEPNQVFASNNNSKVDTNTTLIASLNNDKPKFSKQNYLIVEEAEEEEPVVAAANAKKGFWKRAVDIAKQANKLGLKSLDGEETPDKNYVLSFNSFSVEKH
jgi:hypothetical protein